MGELAEKVRLNKIEINNLKTDIFQLNREIESLQQQVKKLNIDDVSKPFDNRCEQGQYHDCKCVDVCGINKSKL